MPEIQEAYVAAADGQQLFYRLVVPEGGVRGAVIVSHGYAEHSGRYLHVLEALAAAGFGALAMDHRGHGRSARTLGLVESFDAVVEDVSVFRRLAAERFPDRPLFLLGHSMGGMVTLLHIIRYAPDLAGAVVIGTAIEVPENIPPLVIKLAKLLGRVVPKLALQPFYDPTKLTSRVDIQEATRTDPLFYRGKIRARTGAVIHGAMLETRARLREVTVPLLVIHGAADPLVNRRTSEDVYAGVSSEDKTLEMYDGALHEVLNETCADRALALITSWLAEHSI